MTKITYEIIQLFEERIDLFKRDFEKKIEQLEAENKELKEKLNNKLKEDLAIQTQKNAELEKQLENEREAFEIVLAKSEEWHQRDLEAKVEQKVKNKNKQIAQLQEKIKELQNLLKDQKKQQTQIEIPPK